ncbi:hypothetical protein SK128_018265, partial [Halocaridina rubra]
SLIRAELYETAVDFGLVLHGRKSFLAATFFIDPGYGTSITEEVLAINLNPKFGTLQGYRYPAE